MEPPASDQTGVKKPPNPPSNAMESYLNQWNEYFVNVGEKGLLLNLKEKTFNESLRSCHFRSVCWRVFLGSLSDDLKEWPRMIARSREAYEGLRARHGFDPHEDKPENIEVENPLSQSSQSSWSQYFRNSELRELVNRDVLRICPETEFYHTRERRAMMGDVLFCYAKEHENLSYRQGMHELLAPLVFVLHSDLQGAAHARDMGDLPEGISLVLDERFGEHDLYAMFCRLMEVTNAWYSVQAVPETVPTAVEPVPFRKSDFFTDGPPLAITEKLNRIHHVILKKYDLELYHHITRLEIIPQVYGLRWVRLLFGREFDLQDLLVLWDSIFADSRSLDLVDYIFVAMLHNIREQLLACDFCSCTQLLMKYPPIEDIYDLVRMANYYREPNSQRRPSVNRFKGVVENSGPKTKKKENISRKNSGNFFSGIKFDNPFSNKKSNPKKWNEIFQNKSANNSQQTDKQTDKQTVKPTVRKVNQMEAIGQNASACKRLSDLQTKCRNCADILDANIGQFQRHFNPTSDPSATPVEGVSPEGVSPGNEAMLVAVANLKRVRDILRGVVVEK